MIIELRPLAEVRHNPNLIESIPPELILLGEQPEPWTSYVAFTSAGLPVGACAFKEPPAVKQEVEIAYLTFPEFEGQGYGRAMAQSLFDLAARSEAVHRVIAKTLREENASVRICRRLGFILEGEVLDPEDGLVWRWSKATGCGHVA